MRKAVNPRAQRRILKEISQLKKKYPALVVSNDNDVLVLVEPSFVRIGKSITIIIDVSKNYPFVVPIITVSGYLASYTSDWSPQTNLQELISSLLKTIRAAERNPDFVTGGHYEKEPWYLEHPKDIDSSVSSVVTLCDVCQSAAADYACGMCQQSYYCGEDCAQRDWNHLHHYKICKK